MSQRTGFNLAVRYATCTETDCTATHPPEDVFKAAMDSGTPYNTTSSSDQLIPPTCPSLLVLPLTRP